MNFSEKRVLIVGLGESGLAMARWLARCNAILRVADTRTAPERLDQLRSLVPECEFVSGILDANHVQSLLTNIDCIVVSPGLSPLHELQALYQVAQERQIPVWGEVELFSLALAELKEEESYAPKIIAITGTNGKTTVTSLTGQLCARAGLTVKVAGNISPAMLDVLCDCINDDSLPQVWVLELSSFQLHGNFSLNADVATVLNLTQDHLDWHGEMKNYCADKARIFGDTTCQLLNRDDPLVMAMQKPSAVQGSSVIGFSSAAPAFDGDFGLVHEQGMTWLACATAVEEEYASPRKRKKEAVETPVLVSRLMPADALKIRGQHNACNALAALALCRGLGLPLAPLLHALREYPGEPHRVELISSILGVDYFDDSKGTNVGATVAALRGLGEERRGSAPRIILIAGGDGKGQDFSPLSAPVAQYVKAVFLIGKDADKILSTLDVTQRPLHNCRDLDDAVQQAAAYAREGDIVLLSPACASLDMFKNYVHRAQVFADAVREVALASGEIC